MPNVNHLPFSSLCVAVECVTSIKQYRCDCKLCQLDVVY